MSQQNVASMLAPVEVPPMLSQKAVLVDLTVHQWRPVRGDERADEAVQARFGTDRNAGAFRKQLLPQQPPEWKRVTAAASAIGVSHRYWTQPWAAGVRILASKVYQQYAEAMRTLQNEYNEAADAFVAAYPRLRDEAIVVLGGLADENDYPDPCTIRALFGVTVSTMPLPETGDFRVAIDREAVAVMRASYESMMQRALEQANGDLWDRLKSAVERMRESVVKYNARMSERESSGNDGPKRVVLKEGTFDALRELVAVLPAMNIADDGDLMSVVQDVAAKLATVDTESLRGSPEQCAIVVDEADAIMAKMGAFMRRA